MKAVQMLMSGWDGRRSRMRMGPAGPERVRTTPRLSSPFSAACIAAMLVCALAGPVAATVDVSLIEDSVLDTDALLYASGAPYGRAINGVSFQTEPHLTYNGYQFVSWYHLGPSDEDVYLARRNLAGGAWQIMDTGVNLTRTTSDAHNVISIGISGDGRIHVSWDHHGHTLKYMSSNIGAATGGTWNASIFSAERSSLNPGGPSVTGVTYPRFFTDQAIGDMYFVYREGGSGNGDLLLATYDSGAGLWSTRHEIIDGRDGDVYTDALGSSSTRNAYLNGVDIDPAGRIQLTWTWRESASGVNHDIAYAYSDDGGATWRNNVGTSLGTLVKLISPGIIIDDNNPGNGLLGELDRRNSIMNQQTQAVDLDGRVHLIMWHADDAHINALSGFNTTASDYFHYFRNPVSGAWTRRALPTEREVGSRPDMAYDAAGNVYAVYVPAGSGGIYTNGNLVIASATTAADYNDWAIVHTDTRTFIGEPFIDQQRLLTTGVLSVFIQENSSVTTITGSPLHILDFSVSSVLTWAGDDAGVWSVGTGTEWDANGDDIGDTAFSNGDAVRFDDGAATFSVAVSGVVRPGSTEFFNAANPYTLTGAGIGGTGSLTVAGGGTVTLANGANAFSGDTVVENGTLALVGGATIAGSSLIDIAMDGTFDVTGATGGAATLDHQMLAISGTVNGDVVATNRSTVSVNSSSAINGHLAVRSDSVVDGAGVLTGNLDVDRGTVRVGGQELTFGYSDFTIDAFEDYTLGDLVSVASPPWTAHSGSPLAVVEDDGTGNHVLTFGGTSFVGVSRDIPAGGEIDDDETGTFFFRFNARSDTPDFSFGLSDQVDTGSTTFANFECQIRVLDDPGATGTVVVDARDGGSFSATLATGLATESWYNVWMVIDQTTDTYDVYLNSGTDDATPADKRNAAPLHFRNGTTSPLNKILGIGTAPISNAVRYDDLTYLSGVKLTNPLGGLSGDPVGDGATLRVDGDVTLTTDATVEIDVVSPAIVDLLDVGGQLFAGGTLTLRVNPDAPAPATGDAFDIIDAASITGLFAQLDFDPLPPGNVWDMRGFYSTGVIAVLSCGEALFTAVDCLGGPDVAPPGGCGWLDQDGDGDGDMLDFLTFQACVTNAAGIVDDGCLAE